MQSASEVLAMDQSRSLVQIRPRFDTSRSAITFRSMYVTDSNADAGMVAWTSDGVYQSAPIMFFRGSKNADELFFYKDMASTHNTYAPDMRITTSIPSGQRAAPTCRYPHSWLSWASFSFYLCCGLIVALVFSVALNVRLIHHGRQLEPPQPPNLMLEMAQIDLSGRGSA
eukprot:1844265-Amphidinium_carterae.1